MIPGRNYNELRTLEMELDVFEKLKQDFGVSGATFGKEDARKTVTAEMLAGERNAQMAPIGTPGDEGYEPALGDSMKNVLQQFNAFADRGKEERVREKVAILNKWLTDRGFAKIPIYNKEAKNQAKDNRNRLLKELDPKKLPGVLLPKSDPGDGGTPPGPDR